MSHEDLAAGRLWNGPVQYNIAVENQWLYRGNQQQCRKAMEQYNTGMVDGGAVTSGTSGCIAETSGSKEGHGTVEYGQGRRRGRHTRPFLNKPNGLFELHTKTEKGKNEYTPKTPQYNIHNTKHSDNEESKKKR